MTAQHTPGPWHKGADGRIVYDESGWAIANAIVFHGKHNEGQDYANARLIAEAPAMLKTLRELSYWFDADPEVLAAMSDDERADHERQRGKIDAIIHRIEGVPV